ncbi:MAG: ATPase [Bacteroidales bacterium]|nr:ATPase [Bacteroidales bacterium]
MLLIADSGSTKTEWALIVSSEKVLETWSAGLNPNYVSRKIIYSEIKNSLHKFFIKEDEIRVGSLLSFAINPDMVKKIFFYGSGCGTEKNKLIITDVLKEIYSKALISVNTDLQGAARALFKNDEGIACILGTGSNSCYYRDGNIVKSVPSAGYILGDEGSGCYQGKKLLAAWLKDSLPVEIKKLFDEEFNLSRQQIIEKIYKEPQANRFFASFSPFLYKNIKHEFVYNLIKEAFDIFIREYVMRYDNFRVLKVGFVGSVAYHFSELLEKSLIDAEIINYKILRYPIQELVNYHQ